MITCGPRGSRKACCVAVKETRDGRTVYRCGKPTAPCALTMAERLDLLELSTALVAEAGRPKGRA